MPTGKPRTKGRTIRNHALAWAFVALFPYVLVLLAAAFGHMDEPFSQWFGVSLFFLIGSVLIALALCTLELGMLFAFNKAGAMGRTARAAIPGVVIFLLALLVPSPTVTALFPPQPGSIVPLAVIVGVAAALGVGVFISHRRYSAWSTRGMGPRL